MTNLRQAAQAVVERWDTPAWEWRDQGPTADLMADLRTALAQRQWVGLTDEEMSDTVADMEVDFGDLLWKVVCLTKLIEAKLKERNHG